MTHEQILAVTVWPLMLMVAIWVSLARQGYDVQQIFRRLFGG